MAYFFWKQDLMLSYRVTAVFMAIIFFFFLLHAKPNLSYIEKVIWFFCILYIALWLYGLLMAPNQIFGIENENGIDDSRGIFRLSIQGRAFVVLSFFTAISKYVETKKKKWIGIFIFLFIIICMQVIRQVIAFSLLTGLFYLLRKNKYIWLWLSLAVIGMIAFGSMKIDNKSIIGKMVVLSQDQVQEQQSGNENIRITEYRYFFTKYSKNIVTHIFGNGVAHSESEYGKIENKLAQNKALYASDVGYGEIFIRFGLLGLLFYGLIFYRVIKQKVQKKYMYAKLFILYLIFANIAASWIFHDTIVICICLYILETCHKKQLKDELKHKILNRNTRLQSEISERMHCKYIKTDIY
jgi:hypothetical protein